YAEELIFPKGVEKEIEKEGNEHAESIEKIKREIVKFVKIPKNLIIEFLKSCDFITKEDFEKFKEEIKNG
ncbi:MAG: hypothetical protein ACPLZ9_02805, partial [Candidatus Ratteibacteria bacterium]